MIKVILLGFFVALNGCVSTPSVSVYTEVGEMKGIERLVDDLIQNIGNDDQIFHYFAKVNVSNFRKGLITHFCETFDGPCTYEGDSIAVIHTGMNISEKDFNRLVELLIQAMETNHFSYPIQNRVLQKLAPMRNDIYRR